jgi:hypothetical protein
MFLYIQGVAFYISLKRREEYRIDPDKNLSLKIYYIISFFVFYNGFGRVSLLHVACILKLNKICPEYKANYN